MITHCRLHCQANWLNRQLNRLVYSARWYEQIISSWLLYYIYMFEIFKPSWLVVLSTGLYYYLIQPLSQHDLALESEAKLNVQQNFDIALKNESKIIAIYAKCHIQYHHWSSNLCAEWSQSVGYLFGLDGQKGPNGCASESLRRSRSQQSSATECTKSKSALVNETSDIIWLFREYIKAHLSFSYTLFCYTIFCCIFSLDNSYIYLCGRYFCFGIIDFLLFIYVFFLFFPFSLFFFFHAGRIKVDTAHKHSHPPSCRSYCIARGALYMLYIYTYTHAHLETI